MTVFDLEDPFGSSDSRVCPCYRDPPPPIDPATRDRIDARRATRRVYVDEYLQSSASRGYWAGLARVWLVGADFGYGYVTFRDLASTTVLSTSIGERPDWLSQAVEDDGWEVVLGCSCDEYAAWLIECGAAPGQPFRVELSMDVTRSGWEYVEYDVEYDAEVIEVARWSPDRVRSAWDRWARTFLPDLRAVSSDP